MALSWRGVTQFTQKGPPQWNFGDFFGMDSLTLHYSGAAPYLNTFLAGKSKGTPSPVDGNMFLTGISVDDHKQYPTVTLTYTGVKGGGLPPEKNFLGEQIQQVRFNMFPAEGQEFWIELTYASPTSSKRVWGRTPVNIRSIGGVAAPSNATVVWFVAHWENVTPSPPINEHTVLSYFAQREAILGDSEEVVPGKYYVGTQTRQNLLFSSQA